MVSTIGIAIWSADIYLFKLSTWSIILMLVPLWLYWKFLSGNSWPKRTSETRRRFFRSVQLSAHGWKWALVAGLLFVLIVQSCFVITFRIIPLPDSFSSQYEIVESLPASVAWLAIFMSSLVAGVCEEVGFRGYMQVPLEHRYGPGVAIVVTSIVFSLVHLDRSWASTVFPIIFFASVLLGILAYRAQSLIPGIVGHSLLDVFDYSLWWTKLLGKFDWKTISVTGVDGHFVLWCSAFIIATVAFFWAISKLKLSNSTL
ncbi:type II CAAX endopeptidase family protein [Chryseolinea serpens]|uniref:type II CAAX endopeptidase family protein n=1 Tax=Chryseolinea serpens TaxID=947013 RepID=UPI0015BB0236|nr:type II CAAX endopeptidase family protein [Chryseolinea serpens]